MDEHAEGSKDYLISPVSLLVVQGENILCHDESSGKGPCWSYCQPKQCIVSLHEQMSFFKCSERLVIDGAHYIHIIILEDFNWTDTLVLHIHNIVGMVSKGPQFYIAK